MSKRISVRPTIPVSEQFLTIHYDGNEQKIPILHGTDGVGLIDI